MSRVQGTSPAIQQAIHLIARRLYKHGPFPMRKLSNELRQEGYRGLWTNQVAYALKKCGWNTYGRAMAARWYWGAMTLLDDPVPQQPIRRDKYSGRPLAQ